MTHNLEKYEGIYVAGDIHGQPVGLCMSIADYDIKNSAIIILGDIGCGFSGKSPIKNHVGPISYLSKCGKDRNNTFYIFRGNHDNPETFTGEIKEMLEKKYTNVVILGDFDELQIPNGKKGLVVPGAISIDRNCCAFDNNLPIARTDGKNYWHDEPIRYDLIDSIDQHYDFILAHSGPSPMCTQKSTMLDRLSKYDPKLKEDIQIERENIDKIIEKATPKYWINGHFHCTETFVYKDVNVYDLNIDEIAALPKALLLK